MEGQQMSTVFERKTLETNADKYTQVQWRPALSFATSLGLRWWKALQPCTPQHREPNVDFASEESTEQKPQCKEIETGQGFKNKPSLKLTSTEQPITISPGSPQLSLLSHRYNHQRIQCLWHMGHHYTASVAQSL